MVLWDLFVIRTVVRIVVSSVIRLVSIVVLCCSKCKGSTPEGGMFRRAVFW
jgi:hypothetical protein